MRPTPADRSPVKRLIAAVAAVTTVATGLLVLTAVVGTTAANADPPFVVTTTIATVNGAAATSSTPVKAGDVLGYQVAMHNTDDTTHSGTLTDDVPANTTYTGTGEGWSCPAASAAGTTCTQTFSTGGDTTVSGSYTVTADSPLPANTSTIADIVTTSVGNCSACTASNPTVAVLNTVTTVNGDDADSSTPVAAGDVIKYSIAVTNTGGSDGTTQLVDRVPANTTFTRITDDWSCRAPTIARRAAPTPPVAGTACRLPVTVGPAATVTASYTVTVDDPLASGTTAIVNTVISSVGTCSSCSVSNPVPSTLDAVATVTSVNNRAADASTPIAGGDVVVYSIAVTNTGGASSTTTLSDPVPSNTTYSGSAGEGWDCSAPAAPGTACHQIVTVAHNATTTVTYTVTAARTLPLGTTTVTDTVTSSVGTCSSCTVHNPTAAVLDTVKTVSTVNGKPADRDTPLGAGDVVVYSIAVTNSGGSTGATTLSDPVADDLTYTGTGQGWSCLAPAATGDDCVQTVSVAPGATTTVNYRATVVSPLPDGTTTVGNRVSSSNGTCSSCSTANPTGPILDTIAAIVSVNGTPATANTGVQASDVVRYLITVINTGGSNGTTTVTDLVPAHTTYSGNATDGWSCAAASRAGTACGQDLTVTPGQTVSVFYTVTVDRSLPATTIRLTNDVTTSTGGCSSCAVTNPTTGPFDTVTQIATVNGTAATAGTEVAAGDVLAYSVTVTNVGALARTTTVSDPVPADTTYTGAASQGWSCRPGAATGSACARTVTVPAGGSLTLAYTVTAARPLPAGTTTLANRVTSSNGSCSACAAVNATVAILSTVKAVVSVNGANASAATALHSGDRVGYHIVVTNSGGSTATTTLTETVPAGTTYTGHGQGWSCASGDAAGVTCVRSVSVAGAAAVTVGFTATVAGSLPAGLTMIANTVTTSVGACPACTVRSPLAGTSGSLAFTGDSAGGQVGLAALLLALGLGLVRLGRRRRRA